jgi:hypothetical protein
VDASATTKDTDDKAKSDAKMKKKHDGPEPPTGGSPIKPR